MAINENPSLPYLSQEERLKVYQLIVEGCTHLWSKNKLQEDKVLVILHGLYELGQSDPYFLAHFTAWASKQDSKDLQVMVTYANALSSADGRPFSEGSKYKKPNLRYISHIVLQGLDPKLASRVYKLASLKWGVKDKLQTAYHSPTSLINAFRKYLKFRENNLNVVKGISKAGLGSVYRTLYRMLHANPTDQVAGILHWKQKDRKIDYYEPEVNFKGLKDLEIAEQIREKKISYFGVMDGLSRIKKKMSPVIAVAVLEQVTGNQAVILRSMFEEQGVLKDPEVMKLYEAKIREAKTALDRVDTISKDASESVKAALSTARSEVRKKATKGLGKIFLHLDASTSMSSYFEEGSKVAAILAECVDNPKENFKWGMFGTDGTQLPLPETFEVDGFKSILFGKKADAGSTNAFALYDEARTWGAEIDVFITDQEHNTSDLDVVMKRYHEGTTLSKPKACVIVAMDNQEEKVKEAYEAIGVPVSVVKPGVLTQSALVIQTVKTALEGPMVVIDSIMDTELPSYPQWWFTV